MNAKKKTVITTTTRQLQSTLSNTDTEGTKRSLCVREVSLL